MSIPLEEALQNVELAAGQTYRCQVRGQWVELKVLGPTPPAPGLDLESDTMLDPWVDLPYPQPVKIVRSRLLPPPPLDIPEIPTDDDE